MEGFKSYLISEGDLLHLDEQKQYLVDKVGDILSSVQSLREDSPNLSNRDLIRYSQGIVNQIRKVLHGNWGHDDAGHLKTLQKVGVALARGIDSNDDLQEIVNSSAQELETLTGNLSMPLHSLGSPNE